MKYYYLAYFNIYPLFCKGFLFLSPSTGWCCSFILIKNSIHFQCSFYRLTVCVSFDKLEISCFTNYYSNNFEEWNWWKTTRMLEVYFQCRSTSVLYSWSFFFFLYSPCLVCIVLLLLYVISLSRFTFVRDFFEINFQSFPDRYSDRMCKTFP